MPFRFPRAALAIVTTSLLTLVSAGRLEAVCSANVSASVSGTTLSINASGGGACNGSLIVVQLDGINIGSRQCTDSSCDISLTRSTNCLRTGTHTVGVLTECSKTITQTDGSQSCLRDANGSNSTTFTVYSEPSVSISYIGPDAQGNGEVTITYDFPNTDQPGQRKVTRGIEMPGAMQFETIYPDQQSGTWTFPWSLSCYPPGSYRFVAAAETCSGERVEKEQIVSVQARPSAGISYSYDATGKGTVTIHYDFPATSSAGQRTVIRSIEGPGYTSNASIQPDQQSGTWTFPWDVSCYPPGSYTFSAVARHCNGQEVREDQIVTVDARPTVNIDFQPDAEGNGIVTIFYDLPNTSTSGQRRVIRSIEGPGYVSNAAINPDQQSGTWTFPWSVSCWPSGQWTFAAIAEMCNGQNTRAEKEVTTEHKPSASIAIEEAGGNHYAVVTYDFPQTSSAAQRLLRLEWLPSGAFIAQSQPSDYKNVWRVLLPRCIAGQNEMVHVIATGCGDETAEDQAIVPACQLSCPVPGLNGSSTGAASSQPANCPCVADPIQVTSGNMRLGDHDPLPGDLIGPLPRIYDSRNPLQGLFGTGWTSPFDARLRNYTGAGNRNDVLITTETNDRSIFRLFGSFYRQVWPSGRSFASTLTLDSTAGTFTYREEGSGLQRIFRAGDGRLIALRPLSGLFEIRMEYDAGGNPTRVSDSRGMWAWTVSVLNGRISAISVDGQPDLSWSYGYDTAGNLQTVKAGDTTWRFYTYGVEGLLEARDGSGKLLESHAYDEGRAITSTGPSGDVSSIDYSLPGRVPGEQITRVTWTSGRVTEYFTRYIAGEARTVEVRGTCDCGSDDTVYGRDSNGHIVREQGARGFISARQFQNGRVIREETHLQPAGCNPLTDAARCKLDPDSILTAVLHPTAATEITELEYGDANWPEAPTRIATESVLVPGSSKVQTFVYDPATGETLVTSTTGWSGTPSRQLTLTTTTTLYDGTEVAAFNPGGTFAPAWLSLPQPKGLRKMIDGPRTDVADVATFVHYPVDASVPALLRGRLAATRNAAGHISRFEAYDIFGSVTRAVDANGVATESTYDRFGRLLTSTVKGVSGCDLAADPLCATDLTVLRSYESSGPLALETTARGTVTKFEYDERARLTAMSRGSSETDPRERAEYAYDPATGKKNLERFLLNENGAWVEKRRESYVYDSFGRLTRTVHADETSAGYEYDAAGNLTALRDENHTSPNTRYRYDAADHLVEVEQTLGAGSVVTRYEYDGDGNLRSVTDPNGNVTSYVYDDFGRMIRQTSPVTGLTEYSYDTAGNLVTVVDANGAASTRTYDALGRVLTSTTTSPAAPSEQVAWTYDDGSNPFGIGRLASMTDPTGSTSYRYERRGLLLREIKSVEGSLYETSARYDSNGNRSTFVYPSGAVVATSFDFADRPVTLSYGGSPLVLSAAYLPFGPVTSIGYANGTTRTTTHDNRYHPAGQRLSSPGGVLASYDYGHDPAGNVTRVDDLTGSGFNRAFGYDDLHRLTATSSGPRLWGSASYGYDAMGNLRSIDLGSARRTTFSYAGSSPKLMSATENGTIREVTYDAAGNETRTGDQLFAYSARNSLATTGTAEYRYDGRGIRTVTYPAAVLMSVTLAPETATGGRLVTGTVHLTAAAPGEGMIIFLASDSSAAVVPASVVIAPGSQSAEFTISTTSVSTFTTVTIRAAASGVVRSAVLRIEPPAPLLMDIVPASVTGGGTAMASVALTGPAPEEGLALSITHAGSSSASAPAEAVVAAGQTTVAFAISTTPVALPETAEFVATANGRSASAMLFIDPPNLATMIITPAAVIAGNSATATVVLTGAAPAGGVTVDLVSDRAEVTVASPVVIAAGSDRASFTISTAATISGQLVATITATCGIRVVSATLTVDPPPVTLAAVSIEPAEVVGGLPATGRIVLTNPAPAEGALVSVTSSDSFVATVPAQVLVPGGALTATFAIETSSTLTATVAGITATWNGVSQTGLLTVTPPATLSLFSLEVDPRNVVGGGRAIGIVVLSGPAPQGGADVAMTSSDPAVSVPANVKVRGGETTGSFDLRTSAVTAFTEVTISGVYGQLTQRDVLRVIPPTAITLVSVSLTPAQVVGGVEGSGIVTIDRAAPEGGIVVSLGARPKKGAALPATVLIAGGATTATFPIGTQPVRRSTSVRIRASFAGVTQEAVLTIMPSSEASLDAGEMLRARVAAGEDVPVSLSVTTSVVTNAMAMRRISLYTPELNLMAETETTAAAQPTIGYEYVWFNGEPLAQIETSTGAIHYYFNDHLGAPILQTDNTGAVVWRVERDPYGERYATRAGAERHQPLGLPGQEYDPSSDRQYNIFRWYRPSWGRYTQADPEGLREGTNLFSYVYDRPTALVDPYGLAACQPCDECPDGEWIDAYPRFPVPNSGSIGAVVGGSLSSAEFVCPSAGAKSPRLRVRITCWFVGPIAGIGGGVTGPVGTAPQACGCNSKDLLGKSWGLTFSAGPFGLDIGNCSTAPNAYKNTYGGSIMKGFGAGGALTRCTVTKKD